MPNAPGGFATAYSDYVEERAPIMMAIRKRAVEQEKRDVAARNFYRAGVSYITALDGFIEADKENPDRELSASRERVRLMETFLHRLFPDEFADTSSAAE
ncbi:MAG TPA: hypothetical protein VN743_13130 [Blastocatellia bacterium]|nr:hypothetical protein [Blastocatellia bacterium]